LTNINGKVDELLEGVVIYGNIQHKRKKHRSHAAAS